MISRLFFPTTPSNNSPLHQIFLTLGSLLLGLLSVLVAASFIQADGVEPLSKQEPENVFRVCKWTTAPDGSKTQSFKTAGLLGPEIKENLTSRVVQTARFMPWPEAVELSDFRNQQSTEHWAFAEPEILQLFEIKFISGDAESALTAPGQLILSERYAKKLFGNVDPVGKTLIGLGGKIYTVSAVVENVPSSLKFDVLASWASTEDGGLHPFSFMHNWTAQVVETFVQLQDAHQITEAQSAIVGLVQKSPNPSGYIDLFLQPLSGKSPKTGAKAHPDQARYGARMNTGSNSMMLFSKSWMM